MLSSRGKPNKCRQDPENFSKPITPEPTSSKSKLVDADNDEYVSCRPSNPAPASKVSYCGMHSCWHLTPPGPRMMIMGNQVLKNKTCSESLFAGHFEQTLHVYNVRLIPAHLRFSQPLSPGRLSFTTKNFNTILAVILRTLRPCPMFKRTRPWGHNR